MHVRRIELVDFRSYARAGFELDTGLTLVVGANGQGKTNLVEAIGYLATMASFRGVPGDALVRVGAETAVVRAEVVHDDGREVLVECELSRRGRDRVLVNKQRLARTRDLLGVVRVSVFSPDDLALVKEGPALRRGFLDDTLVALSRRHDQTRRELDRVLRQRNVLLKQAGGRLDDDVAFTLDVWDAKLAEAGEALGAARARLVDALAPLVEASYADLAGPGTAVTLRYDPPWRRPGLAAALAASRRDDVRRQISLVGPHRDELDLELRGLPARTHASQGEQRTLALALRLAAHRLVAERVGSPPVLVLDDVFSELDPTRRDALVRHLPPGQVVLTSAGVVPDGVAPGRVLHIEGGHVVAGSAP